jgi:hypothetical protein
MVHRTSSIRLPEVKPMSQQSVSCCAALIAALFGRCAFSEAHAPEEVAGDLEEKPKVSPGQRRAKDPDSKFEWEDGILRCPVRRHDFRLFEFSRRTSD